MSDRTIARYFLAAALGFAFGGLVQISLEAIGFAPI